jgi:hypothetical protein
MDRYAQNCKACSSGTSRTVLICGGKPDEKGLDYDVVVEVPQLDYMDFSSLQEFDEVKSGIQNALASVILSDETVHPVAVLFHNSSLGKNIAASAAFARIARQSGSDKIRFFPVLHDFAEEGRTAMISQIHAACSWGWPIYGDLYFAEAPVIFVVPGIQAFNHLKALDFPVRLLPNPIRTGETFLDMDMLLNQRSMLAGGDKRYDSSRPLWYYPSRIIRRKNILEAVLLSMIMETVLILGPQGTSRIDLPLNTMLSELVQKFNLNVLINPAKNRCASDPVAAQYAICEYAVSTSVAEGWGVGLYESAFYNRPLLGRYPGGFIYPCAVSTGNLYGMVPVPAAFVDKEELIKNYYEKFGPSDAVHQKMVRLRDAECIDFADLDLTMQKSLIERFLGDSMCRKEWLKVLETRYLQWPGTSMLCCNARKVFDQKRLILQEYFSLQNDLSRFFDTFSKIPAKISVRSDFSRLSELFLPDRMNLLL